MKMELSEWIDSVNVNRIIARVENDDSEGCRWLVLTAPSAREGRSSSFYIDTGDAREQEGG